MARTIKIFGALGTGKTETLTNTLINSLKRYKPEEILFVTYTRGGAFAIRERLEQKGFDPKEFPYIGTMHSICSRLIGLVKEQRMNDAERTKFITQFKYEYESEKHKENDEGFLDAEKFVISKKPFANACLGIIARCRNAGQPVKNWKAFIRDDDEEIPFTNDTLMAFYERYERYKQANDKMDYEDILERVIDNEVLPPEIKIAFFDEFQDFWMLLFEIYKMWRAYSDMETIYIAGDPNQTIYRYAGADPMMFINEVADETRILDVNFRCKENIWEFAKDVIGSASLYDIKRITAKNQGGSITRITLEKLYPILTERNNLGVPSLMLTRTNRQANRIYKDMLDRGVPVKFTTIEGKINESFRNASNFIIKLNAGNFTETKWKYIEVGSFLKRVKVAKSMLKRGIKAKADHHVLKETDWDYIDVLQMFELNHPSEPMLLAKLCDFDDYQLEFFSRYLDAKRTIPKPIIEIGTMHSGKGRTIPSVFFLNEMPYMVRENWTDSMEQDERRLCYMACGRAINELVIVDHPSFRYPFL